MGNMQVGSINFTGARQDIDSKKSGKVGKVAAGALAAAAVVATAVAANKGDVFEAVKKADAGQKLKTFFSKETFNGETLGKLGSGFTKLGQSIADAATNAFNSVRKVFQRGEQEAAQVVEELPNEGVV